MPLAPTPADVLDSLARGRSVLTFKPEADTTDPRFPEMRLADETVRGRPDLFRRVGAYPLRIDFYYSPGRSDGVRGRVEVWEYLAELPLVVPTAGIGGK